MDSEAWAAAKEGNLKKLKGLLKQGFNINKKDVNGQTLLHLAASSRQKEVLKYLVAKGADVLATDEKNNTALHVAVTNRGDGTAVMYGLLENVPRTKLRELLNAKIEATGNTALHITVKNNFAYHAMILLSFGANFEVTNNNGEKPVDLAIDNCLRELMTIIGARFEQAKNKDERLISDLKSIYHTFSISSAQSKDESRISDSKLTSFISRNFFTSLSNCRNNEGHTITQVLLLNKSSELLPDFCWFRIQAGFGINFQTTYNRNRVREMNRLAEQIKECQQFPSSHSRSLMESLCRALEKAHEVLCAYRKFYEDAVSQADQGMNIIEEVLEILGFDPDQLPVNFDDEASYFKKLPVEWKKDPIAFAQIIDDVIYPTISYYADNLNTVRLIHAVNDDDEEKVQYVLDSSIRFDVNAMRHEHRTLLCFAAEIGNKKVVDLILKSGANVVVRKDTISPVYLAAKKGNAEVVELLLKHIDIKDMAEYIDWSKQVDRTALHAAAKKGHLDIVKILLRHGATYAILDGKGRTPLKVSTSEEVSLFLKIVDECFEGAKEADDELVHKLRALDTEDFMAVAFTRNREGQTLAAVAAKANAKNIAVIILTMIKEAKCENK